MDHVPTLCAFGTLGVAAAGLALGCPGPKSRDRKRFSVISRSRSRASSTPLQPLCAPSPVPSAMEDMPSSPHETVPTNTKAYAAAANSPNTRSPDWVTSDGKPLRRDRQSLDVVEEATNHTTDRSRPKSYADRESSCGGDEAADWRGFGSRRPSSSWARRFSTVSSSQNGSVLSGSRMDTPSANGSTVPFISSETKENRPAPNKLVKRSTSQRLRSVESNTGTLSRSQTTAFRRPATSHQRSATLNRLQTLNDLEFTFDEDIKEFEEDPVLPAGVSLESNWRPYFRGENEHANKYSRRGSQSTLAKPQSIKRIVKSPAAHPTLVMATSITKQLAPDSDMPIEVQVPEENRHIFNDQDEVSKLIFRDSAAEQTDVKIKRQDSFSLANTTWKKAKDTFRRRGSAPIINLVTTTQHTQESDALNASHSPTPAGRRSITDPTLFDPPSNAASASQDRGIMRGEYGNKSSTEPLEPLSAFEFDLPPPTNRSSTSTPLSETRSSSQNYSYVPGTSFSSAPSGHRPKRVSMTASDPASTLISSDNDTRVFTSGDEDDIEFQSDTAYDSVATRRTSNSFSGARGPKIGTIFDESPPAESTRPERQEGSLERASTEHETNMNGLDAFEFSTPVRSILPHDRGAFSTPVAYPSRSPLGITIPSSPPEAFVCSDLPELAWPRLKPRAAIAATYIPDDEDWDSCNEMEPEDDLTQDSSPDLPKQVNRKPGISPLRAEFQISGVRDSQGSLRALSRELKPSLFDWSEQSGENSLNGDEPRPKTVHGKRPGDSRGSRVPGRTGRRVGSALHLRSQSVPVAREPTNSHDIQRPTTAKFGTWGLGTKGASEDWNDDFDFDEEEEELEITLSPLDDCANPSGQPMSPFMMKVPQSIMERQASVHGQFGQVQELTLLVEELRRLRTQAGILDLMSAGDDRLWKEAEGIINLATLDDSDNEFEVPKSPSSPGFDFDAFDERSSPAVGHKKASGASTTTETGKSGVETPSKNRDSHPSPATNRVSQNPSTPPVTPQNRPRGNSSARVKSVLETIYQQRSDKKEIKFTPQQKLPFDTQSLRDLVSRASVVTRALKEIVRKAEGVRTSPADVNSTRFSDPPFSQIFATPQEDLSAYVRPGIPKSRSANGYMTTTNGGSGGNGGGSTTETELSGRLKLMTVV